MNILHFSTQDITGGAAKASYRLHCALRAAGHDSRMLVREKRSGDGDVTQVRLYPWRSGVRRLFFRVSWFRSLFLPSPTYFFNLDIHPHIDTRTFYGRGPGDVDVVCLHWVTKLLSPETIRMIRDHFRRPLVWVLMDQEPLTGGCHYAFGCEGYTKMCGCCPQLRSDREEDPSRRTWRSKQRHLQDLPITFVAPTGWVERRIRASSLFSRHRVARIPLSVDIDIFRPVPKEEARALLGIPPGRKVVFFASTSLDDPRKGMPYLAEAFRILGSSGTGPPGGSGVPDLLLLSAGRDGEKLLATLPFPHLPLGFIDDEARLALAYGAADVFVCPSVEDAGPMMIPEAMLCGTPVVAFDAGGAPDLVRTTDTGYLAVYRDSADLARGILAVLDSPVRERMGERAREMALGAHAPGTVAERYMSLFDELLGGKG